MPFAERSGAVACTRWSSLATRMSYRICGFRCCLGLGLVYRLALHGFEDEDELYDLALDDDGDELWDSPLEERLSFHSIDEDEL